MAGKRLFAGSQKAVSAKESAEWLYNERSKFEATQEPVYQVGDTVFLEGEAYNITAIGTTDVQLLPPGMVYPIYRAESKENFERLLRQDERNARFISGEEPEKLLPQLSRNILSTITMW